MVAFFNFFDLFDNSLIILPSDNGFLYNSGKKMPNISKYFDSKFLKCVQLQS